MYLEPLVTVSSLAMLLLLERLHQHLRRALRPVPLPPRPASYPSVTIVRPIRGLDPGAEENLDAALTIDYPGEVEQLFVFDDESEPAVPLVRAAIRRRAAPARVLFCGAPPLGRTGKLNAMIVGTAEARNELIAFADSDIRPDPKTLTNLVAVLLSHPEAGAAFAPVVVIGRPRTAGDAGYGLLLNGLYGPAAALAARRLGGELPFIMGQFMVFHRRTLHAIGGLESADGQLVDDMYLGARVTAVGLRNVLATRPVPIVQEGLGPRDFFKVYVRWLTFARTGLPGRAFKSVPWLHGLLFWLGLLIAGWAAENGWGLAAVLGALVTAGVAASINALHARAGGQPLRARHLWVSWALLFLAPLVLLTVHLRRRVEWRGRVYSLDARSRLRPASMIARPRRDRAAEVS